MPVKPECAMSDQRWPEGAECLFDAATVSQALDAQADRLAKLAGKGEVISLVALMKGGMYPVIELSRRLGRAVRIDYVHATRYREGTSGGRIEWAHWPEDLPTADHVVLVDDIFDEGYTLQAVVERLHSQGLSQVSTMVLTRKVHDRGLARDWVDDYALEVPDRYVFGCGMDYQGLWRQLDSIWALPS